MIQLNNSIEAIFNRKNIDFGNHFLAIELFLQLSASTAKHFMEDEHWEYFDDYYSPDYACMDTFEAFENVIQKGFFSEDEKRILVEGLQEVKQMEAVQNYGCPGVGRVLRVTKG